MCQTHSPPLPPTHTTRISHLLDDPKEKVKEAIKASASASLNFQHSPELPTTQTSRRQKEQTPILANFSLLGFPSFATYPSPDHSDLQVGYVDGALETPHSPLQPIASSPQALHVAIDRAPNIMKP